MSKGPGWTRITPRGASYAVEVKIGPDPHWPAALFRVKLSMHEAKDGQFIVLRSRAELIALVDDLLDLETKYFPVTPVVLQTLDGRKCRIKSRPDHFRILTPNTDKPGTWDATPSPDSKDYLGPRNHRTNARCSTERIRELYEAMPGEEPL